jgi:ATP-dependent Clp protease ATP-binding subunit ClpA
MFERFTDRAKTVVALAREEARNLDHDYIGTEHILLGLIHEGEGVAAKALEALGISLEAVRQQVEEIIGHGQKAPSGHIPFTPRAKKVLELSLREALQLGHNYIGTEHILLGLIREGHGVAAQVLVRLGADLNRVRQQVRQLLYRESEEPGSARERAMTRVRISTRAESHDYSVSEPSLFDLLTSIGERLTAIERRLGIPGLGEQEGSAREHKPSQAAAGTAAEKEAARARTEATRLRALLRQHGIDPGGDQDDPAAAD